jgi:hypothetical protein
VCYRCAVQGQELDAELIDGIEFERDHASGLRRQIGKGFGDVSATLDAEDVGDACGVQAITIDGRMDAVLERGAQIAQSHAGTQ